MKDAGIHPSNEMYHDISSFSQKCCGAENAAVIKERLGMELLIFLLCQEFRSLMFICMCFYSVSVLCSFEQVYIIQSTCVILLRLVPGLLFFLGRGDYVGYMHSFYLLRAQQKYEDKCCIHWKILRKMPTIRAMLLTKDPCLA